MWAAVPRRTKDLVREQVFAFLRQENILGLGEDGNDAWTVTGNLEHWIDTHDEDPDPERTVECDHCGRHNELFEECACVKHRERKQAERVDSEDSDENEEPEERCPGCAVNTNGYCTVCEMMTCAGCGRVWDGHAQCDCDQNT